MCIRDRIELFGDVGGRRAVTQEHCGERQARSRKGLGSVIPAQFLHPLLQPFGDQLFHLLRRRPRPSRDDGHLLDREGRVFRPAQDQEGHDAGDEDRHEQEQGDGALAYGESGEVEAAHRGLAPLTATLCAASLSMSRTDSPSCSRCAPSATTRSPALRLPTTEAASPLRPAICTARQVTRGVSPSTSQTPGPLPGSKIAPIGTCSAGADRPSGTWRAMVEPSGASASRPSSAYRASKVRVWRSASSDNWRSFAGPVSPFPYSIARPGEPMAGRRVSGRSMTASRRPACATRTTTWPACTTCPGSARVSTTTPSASARRTA